MAFGKCPRCQSSARSVLLIGGLCSYHFKGGNEEIERNASPAILKDLAAKTKAKTLKTFFDEHIKKCPEKCENCHGKITFPADVSKRAAIAHICPKSTVKSVATNDFNVIYLCWQCHSDYDLHPAEKVASMSVIKIARERFNQFKHLIPEEEQKHIPEYLTLTTLTQTTLK